MKQGGTRVKWTAVDGKRTRLRVVPGAGPTGEQPHPLPLLLLHGLGCSSDAWLPSLRRFAALPVPPRVIAPDFPGYGRSSHRGPVMGMDEMADWAARLLDTLEIDRAVVAGNSMGCQVALAMARRHPDRVGALALLGPTLGDSHVSLWRYASGLVLDGFGESLRYNLLLLRMYAQMGLVRYLVTVRRMMQDDPLAHAGEIRAPVLVLRGGHDRVVSEAMARSLTEALPRAEYQPLDSTAHAAEFNTPELFSAAVLEFLARVGVREASPGPIQASVTGA